MPRTMPCPVFESLVPILVPRFLELFLIVLIFNPCHRIRAVGRTTRPLPHALKTEHSDLSQLAMCRPPQLVPPARSPSQHWSSRMQEIEGYLRHAAECREMAQAASLSHRQQLEQMAETWDELANARKRQLTRWGEITAGPTDE